VQPLGLDEPTEIASRFSRAGRPFEPVAERHVVPSLRLAARKLAVTTASPVVMVPECPLPAGVPDLLVLVADERRLTARLRSDVPPILAQQEVRLLAACGPRRPARIERLAEVTGLAAGQTRRLLARLVRVGALERTEAGWRRNDAIAPFGRTYALEAKVSDWRSGIAQCLRYGAFTDGTGLALGRVSAQVAKSAVEFGQQHRIGVFIDGRWKTRPRMIRHSLERRLWLAEHIAAALREVD
jgi:hypothetical protein